MNRNRLVALAACAALAAAGAGCRGDDANANHANTNHSNTAVVTNSGANTAVNANTNASASANANRASYNANMTREEYDKNKESYASDAKSLGRKIGSGANDGWLWVKVRGALAAADDLRDSTINVDVDNAVVTLSGTVADGKQKIRAVDVAKKVNGVTNVKNEITVSGGGAGGNSNAANANAHK